MRKLAAAVVLAVVAGCGSTGGSSWREFGMDPELERFFAQNVRTIYLRIFSNPGSAEIAQKWPEASRYHEEALRAARLILEAKGYQVEVLWQNLLDYSWREKNYPTSQKVVLKDDRYLSESSALIELYAGEGGSRREPTKFSCLSIFYLNPDFRAAHRWTDIHRDNSWDYVMRSSLADIPPRRKEGSERLQVPAHKHRKPAMMLACTECLTALRSQVRDYTFTNLVCTAVWHEIKVERAGAEAGKIIVFMDEPRRYDYDKKPYWAEREHEGAQVREEERIGDRNFVFYKRDLVRVGFLRGGAYVFIELQKKNESEDVVEQAARKIAETALFHLEAVPAK